MFLNSGPSGSSPQTIHQRYYHETVLCLPCDRSILLQGITVLGQVGCLERGSSLWGVIGHGVYMGYVGPSIRRLSILADIWIHVSWVHQKKHQQQLIQTLPVLANQIPKPAPEISIRRPECSSPYCKVSNKILRFILHIAMVSYSSNRPPAE